MRVFDPNIWLVYDMYHMFTWKNGDFDLEPVWPNLSQKKRIVLENQGDTDDDSLVFHKYLNQY